MKSLTTLLKAASLFALIAGFGLSSAWASDNTSACKSCCKTSCSSCKKCADGKCADCCKSSCCN